MSFSRIDGRYCTQEDAERLNGQPTEVKEDIDAQTRPREGRMKLYVILPHEYERHAFGLKLMELLGETACLISTMVS